jgi:hypothetical protein
VNAKINTVLFWICAVGSLFNTMAWMICARVPQFHASEPYFILGAISFSLGALNYYLIDKRFGGSDSTD